MRSTERRGQEIFALPGGGGRAPVSAASFALVIGICAVHIWATWGAAALYFGDYGTWLHAVERFASGETPYVDFHWLYPPLSLWLVGIPARLFAPSLPVIWTVTSLIFVCVAIAYARYVGLLAEDRLARWIVLAGLLFAMAYAPIGSAALPMGMYTPAAPLAGLMILLTAAAMLQAVESERMWPAVWLGVSAALCVFTKQDIWMPALYLLLVGAFFAWRRGSGPSPLVPIVACTATVAVGIVSLGLAIGWSNLPRAAWTPGAADIVGGRALFSWERFWVQVSAAGTLIGGAVAVVWAFDRSRARLLRAAVLALFVAGLAAAVHVAGSYASGMAFADAGPGAIPTETQTAVTSAGMEPLAVLKRSVRFFMGRFPFHLLPTIFPLVIAAVVAFRPGTLAPERRRLLLVLLGLALTARARRGFEQVDWFHFLLETPVYALFLTSYFGIRPLGRPMKAILAAWIAVGGYMYWSLGAGRLSERGRRVNVPVESARGTFLSNQAGARWLGWLRSTLEEHDPGGEVPLLVFGQTGGMNYWVGRENPTPWLLGTEYSFWDRDSILAPLLPPGRELFFLDAALYDNLTRPRLGLALRRWDLEREPSRFAVDARLMLPFVRDCERVGLTGNPEAPFFELYHCSGDS